MSEENNILTGGTEVLEEMKATLLQLDELQCRTKDLLDKQTALEKEIAAKTKVMNAEITSVISKRQSEVEKTYDIQIEKTRERIKMVKAKRDKYKGTKVSERISDETSELREQIRSLKQDIKGIFSREHICRIYNSKFFFSMFMPSEIGDFLTVFLVIILILALPLGIYAIAIPAAVRTWWMLALLYLGVVAVAFILFMVFFKGVRMKHLEAFREVKTIRDKISFTEKRIKRLEKSIIKDKDESTYGLEKYDEEISGLDARIDEIIAEKKQALTEFENQTKKNVTEEIKARYNGELEALKTENETAYDEQRAADGQIKSLSLELSRKYEAYVGKENLSVPVIESLISIIQNGEATNIADALVCYKRQLTEGKKDQE